MEDNLDSKAPRHAITVGTIGLVLACLMRLWATRFYAIADDDRYMALTDIAWFAAYASIAAGAIGLHALLRSATRKPSQ